MGQQASSVEQDVGEAEYLTRPKVIEPSAAMEKPQRQRAWLSCCSPEVAPKGNRATDSVQISGTILEGHRGENDSEPVPDSPAAASDVLFGDALQARSGDLSQSSLEAQRREVSAHRPVRPASSASCFCGLGVVKAPTVRIESVGATMAEVKWDYEGVKDVRRFHIDVVHLGHAVVGPEEELGEVAFFESGADSRSFELPEGTLKRASGPYQVRVLAEIGPEGVPESRRTISSPGISRPFETGAEAPGRVVMLRLAAAPEEDGISIRWGPPADDGGVEVVQYEVTVHLPPKDVDAASSPSQTVEDANKTSMVSKKTTKDCSFDLNGLVPGSGPYRFEVVSKNAADLTSDPSFFEASTAIGAPAIAQKVRARLMPAHYRGTLESGRPMPKRDISAENPIDMDDIDVVRIEFLPPKTTGGRDISNYVVYALEEPLEVDDEDFRAASPPEKGGANGSTDNAASATHDEDDPAEDLLKALQKAKQPDQIATFLASECFAGKGNGLLSVDVAVGPNRAYTFYVQAHNGALSSDLGDASNPVFVPARVPVPPKEPPTAFRVEGGYASELRWIGPLTGGGLPILSWKVGVMGPYGVNTNTAGTAVANSEVTREITITASVASLAAKNPASGVQWSPLLAQSGREALYGAKVDGLLADARYCFVLAASNAMGTGRWGMASQPMLTACGAPPPPTSAVATVCVDDKQRVVVTVNWEIGRPSAGGVGSVPSHFLIMLVPAGGQTSASSSSAAAASTTVLTQDSVIRERLPASSIARDGGKRYEWGCPLGKPGVYSVTVTAENGTGQRSAPTILTLDVRPEVFPMREEQAQRPPRWAEEPILVLGPAASHDDARFGEFEEGMTWLQALLLWHDDDPDLIHREATAVQRMSSGRVDSGVDVVAFYRRPGSSVSHAAVLSAGVTASRLQVALPSHIPMSLRLISRSEPIDLTNPIKPSTLRAAQARSEPMLLMMSEESEHLRPTWEVWARQTASGAPPRWTFLPEPESNLLEVTWLEEGNLSKVRFNICPGSGSELPPGLYEVTFGDEREVQHTVQRLGVGGWTARARRSVRDPSGEEASMPNINSDDLCVICMERRRTHAFMHHDTGDGHLAVCGECASSYRAEASAGGGSRAVRTCPMCRRNFSSLQRIYQ